GPPLEANDNRPTENHGDGRIAEAAAKKFKSQHSAAEAVQENSVGAAKERVSLPDVETPSVAAGSGPSGDPRAGRWLHPYQLDQATHVVIRPRSMMLTL